MCSNIFKYTHKHICPLNIRIQMLTKVIKILDININMDKFYMSIFVYVLERQNTDEHNF